MLCFARYLRLLRVLFLFSEIAKVEQLHKSSKYKLIWLNIMLLEKYLLPAGTSFFIFVNSCVDFRDFQKTLS